MQTVTMDLPEEVFSALRRSPDEFAREMRLAAAMLWYSRGLVSQEKGAQIAGVNRADFLAHCRITRSTFLPSILTTSSGSWIVADAVVNASPRTPPGAAGLTDLLQLAGQPLLVPQAVVEEIETYGLAHPTAAILRHLDWLTIVESQPIPSIIERWDLGLGESSVLAWAHTHSGTVAVLDDLPARWCADALGIPTVHPGLGSDCQETRNNLLKPL